MYKTGNRFEGTSATMRIVWTFIRQIGLTLLRVDAHISFEALERLRTGGTIVSANHVSFIDGLAIALASPVPLIFGVDVAYSRQSRFSRMGLDLLACMGFGEVVPLDADHPFGMRKLKRCLSVGQSVMIFPEGRISPDGLPLPKRPGIVWLKEGTGAMIVDVRIRGAEQSRLFAKAGRRLWPRIAIHFQTQEDQCDPRPKAATNVISMEQMMEQV